MLDFNSGDQSFNRLEMKFIDPIFKIQVREDHFILNGQDGDHGFDGCRSAKCMAGEWLGRGNGRDGVPEYFFYGNALGEVVIIGAGSMGIDVAD